MVYRHLLFCVYLRYFLILYKENDTNFRFRKNNLSFPFVLPLTLLSHRMNFTLLKLNCLKIWYPVISGLLGFVQSELRGMKTSRWHLIPAYLWGYWFILGRVGLDSGYTQNCQSLQFGKVKLGALGVTLTSGKSSALWFQLRLWSSFSHIHVTIHTYTYIAKQSRTIHILFF